MQSPHPEIIFLPTPLKYSSTGRIEEFLKPYFKHEPKKPEEKNGGKVSFGNTKEIFAEVYRKGSTPEQPADIVARPARAHRRIDRRETTDAHPRKPDGGTRT